VSDGVRYSLTFAMAFMALMVVVADRPEKRPGNLAPIQLIMALGAWALIVVNSVVAAVACASGSAALAVAPVATILCAAILFARGAGSEGSARSLPDSVDAVIGEIRDLLGGARRLGLNEIDAVLTGNGPSIGVTVPSRGRVVVRIHESLVPWIERHRRRSAATIGSFIRFAVLHELGHILNGDHRTYRFARSVLIAHLWWLLAAPLALGSGDAKAIVSATIFVTLLVAAQSLMARRFSAERERLADWRAMQSLSTADASRLLLRSGIALRGRPAPTEIEKLMIDLKATPGQAKGISAFSRFVRLLLPAGDNSHQRAEALAGDRAGAPASPLQWAALTGMQCGVLATSVAIGIFLVTRRMDDQTALWVVMFAMSWIGGSAGTYCVMRTDPARLSVSGGISTAEKMATGVSFFLTFTCAATATHQLARWLAIRTWVSGLALAVAIVITIVVIAGCAVLAGLIHAVRGEGALRMAPRERWVSVVPPLVAMAIVLGPFNVVLSARLGLGGFLQGAWVAIMICALGTYVLSIEMANSPNAVLRALAPVAVLDNWAPLYRFRFFWWEFSFDITRFSLVRGGAIVFAFQTAVLLILVVAFGFAMHRVEQLADFKTTFTAFFWGGVGLFMLFTRIPDRSTKVGVRVLQMVDRTRLEILGALLAGARHADPIAAERIRSALASWISSDDRFVVALLPDRRSMRVLSPLLTFIRLARSAGAGGILDRARDLIDGALRDVLAVDAVTPSLFYSTLAASIVDEAGLADRFPLERMIDRVGEMLAGQLSAENVNLVTDIVAAARLLQSHGRPIPDTATISRFVRRSTLMSKPVHGQSLVELCELADLLGDAQERERLAPIVRSRLWEILQLNPRKEVLALLDCYLAAIRLGEHDSPLVSAAAVTIGEIAVRTADELMAA
jgi:peptidase M48-like protein